MDFSIAITGKTSLHESVSWSSCQSILPTWRCLWRPRQSGLSSCGSCWASDLQNNALVLCIVRVSRKRGEEFILQASAIGLGNTGLPPPLPKTCLMCIRSSESSETVVLKECVLACRLKYPDPELHSLVF